MHESDFAAENRNRPGILIVDDDLNDQTLVKAMVSAEYDAICVDSARDALACVADFVPDCILVDFLLPQMDGLCLVAELRRNPSLRYVPIIMLTSFGTAETAVDALKSGVDDYLSKESLNEQMLVKILEHAQRSKAIEEAMDVERHSMVQENQELMRRHQLFADYWNDVAHNLLTNVSAVQEFVTILMDELPGPVNEEQGKCLALARGGCVDIERSVEKILGATRLMEDPGKMVWAPEDLAIVVEQAIDEIRLEALSDDVTIVTAFEDQPQVFTDKFLLNQLLYALMVQGLRVTPKGGELFLGIGVETDGKTRVVVRGRCDERSGVDVSDFEVWQINEALKNANASNFQRRLVPGIGLELSFDLVKFEKAGSRSAA